MDESRISFYAGDHILYKGRRIGFFYGPLFCDTWVAHIAVYKDGTPQQYRVDLETKFRHKALKRFMAEFDSLREQLANEQAFIIGIDGLGNPDFSIFEDEKGAGSAVSEDEEV